MSQKVEGCTVILSENGETLTLNVDVVDGVAAVPLSIDRSETNMTAVQNYFNRHGTMENQ